MGDTAAASDKKTRRVNGFLAWLLTHAGGAALIAVVAALTSKDAGEFLPVFLAMLLFWPLAIASWILSVVGLSVFGSKTEPAAARPRNKSSSSGDDDMFSESRRIGPRPLENSGDHMRDMGFTASSPTPGYDD